MRIYKKSYAPNKTHEANPGGKREKIMLSYFQEKSCAFSENMRKFGEKSKFGEKANSENSQKLGRQDLRKADPPSFLSEPQKRYLNEGSSCSNKIKKQKKS